MFRTSTPFVRIEDPDLIEAFRLLGVQLPKEKALRTTQLDRVYKTVQEEVADKIKQAQVRSTCHATAELPLPHTHSAHCCPSGRGWHEHACD
jgi:hypothetical protein